MNDPAFASPSVCRSRKERMDSPSPVTVDTSPQTMASASSALRPPSGERSQAQRHKACWPASIATTRSPSPSHHGGGSSSSSGSGTNGLSSCRTQIFNTDSFSVAPTEDSELTGGGNENAPAVSLKCLYTKAYDYLTPGPIFRNAVHLYAERKLLVFFLIHLSCTMIVWFHFAFKKFEQRKDAVPWHATFYWWKVLAPSLEFGSMHAILLQMALIPLTMARYSISMAAGSVLDRFIPLNRTLRMHVHLGYTMIIIVFVATLFFFLFFGLLCNRGEREFCAKFTSEIMCTGYGILASLLIVAGTSHFRHKIPYELFYVIHHLVFVMYIITVAHTFDIEQRKNRADRSQTFKWFSATILYYVCDRAAMHLNHKYRTRLVSSSSIAASNGENKMVILNLRRPALFRFKPGQYAYLRIGKIDNHWHPFSIASDPSSPHLQFYVEVFKNKSWTGKLWKLLEEDQDTKFSYRQIDVEVMGPIGTPLAKTENYSHTLAIGSGTGIVPILSLFKQQVHQLLRLDPDAHFRELQSHRTKVHAVEVAEQIRKGSFVELLLRWCRFRKRSYLQLNESRGEYVKKSIRHSIARCETGNDLSRQEVRNTMAQMKKAASLATRSIYGTVLLSVLPVIGITLIGLMLSWNTIQVDMPEGMLFFLKWFTVGFQACFAVTAFFIWNATEFFIYIDLVMTVISPFADWYWLLQCQLTGSGTLNNGNLMLYCLLTGYMVFRLWSMAVIPRHRSWKNRVEDEGVRTMERFDIVWVTRSAALVSEILPDINVLWTSLVDTWGETNAASVCRISIYVTDRDPNARRLLIKEMRNTELYKNGSIHFGRPNLSAVIQDHTIELIATRRHSHSLLAYVGSPQLGQELHRCKISNDMVTVITGHTRHQMEFVSDSYGGKKAKKKAATTVAPETTSQSIYDLASPSGSREMLDETDLTLSIRKTTSYEDGGARSNRFDDEESRAKV